MKITYHPIYGIHIHENEESVEEAYANGARELTKEETDNIGYLLRNSNSVKYTRTMSKRDAEKLIKNLGR